jgi:hypothetical protein
MHAASRDAMASRCSTSRNANSPPSDDILLPSNRATIALPWTGDRPGKKGDKSSFDGHALPGSDGIGFNTN